MTNQLLNTDPNFRNHPLHNLLCDCIQASTCGAGTVAFEKAVKIPGWLHKFVKWDGMWSVEMITWDNDDVFDKLKKLYQS